MSGSHNLAIDAEPRQQETSSPRGVVVLSSSRWLRVAAIIVLILGILFAVAARSKELVDQGPSTSYMGQSGFVGSWEGGLTIFGLWTALDVQSMQGGGAAAVVLVSEDRRKSPPRVSRIVTTGKVDRDTLKFAMPNGTKISVELMSPESVEMIFQFRGELRFTLRRVTVQAPAREQNP